MKLIFMAIAMVAIITAAVTSENDKQQKEIVIKLQPTQFVALYNMIDNSNWNHAEVRAMQEFLLTQYKAQTDSVQLPIKKDSTAPKKKH